MGVAEVLRPICQARDVSVGGAATRALLDDAHEIACQIGLALEVADAEKDAAIPRLQEQPIG